MELVRRPDGSVVEVAPKFCPVGHGFGPGRVLVGWKGCLCTPGENGHRLYHCLTCEEEADAVGRPRPEPMLDPPCVDEQAGQVRRWQS